MSDDAKIVEILEHYSKTLDAHNETFGKMFQALAAQQKSIGFLFNYLKEMHQRLVMLEGNNGQAVLH